MPQQAENLKKIIATLQTLPPKADLETEVKKNFTLPLWGSTLIQKESWQGRVSETVRSYLKLDNAPDRVPRVFRRTVRSFKFSDLEGLPSSQKKTLYRLRARAPHGLKALAQEVQERATQPATAGATHRLENPELLKELSLLKDFKPKRKAIDGPTLQALSTPSVIDPLTLLHYSSYFPRSLRSQLEQAGCEEAALQKVIASKNPEELGPLAKNSVERLRQSVAGDKYLIFGGFSPSLPQLSEKMTHGLSNFFHKFSGNWADAIAQEFEMKWDQMAEINTFSPETVEKFHALLKGQLMEVLCPEINKSLLENQSLLKQCLLMPAELARLGMKQMIASLSQDLSQSISEQCSRFLTEESSEALRQAILEKRFGAEIKKKIREGLRSWQQKGQEHILQGIGNAISSFSPHLLDAASCLGFGNLGKPGQCLGFQFMKQENGLYQLKAFGKEESLLFTDLSLEMLDEDFFYALFAMRALSQWHPSHNYTLSDLYEGLFRKLPPPQPLANAETFLPQKGSVASLIRHEMRLGSKKKEALFHFQWKEQALLHTWAWAEKNRSFREVKWAAEALVQEAISLYDQRWISLEKLERIYATHWDIVSRTSQAEVTDQKRALLPPALASRLTALLGSAGAEEASFIKDLLIGSLGSHGEEVETMLNGWFQDLYGQPSPPAPFWQRIKQCLLEKVRNFPGDVTHTLLYTSLGLSFQELLHPSRLSTWKIILTTTRIATATLFPGVGLFLYVRWTTMVIAKQMFTQIACQFMPVSMQNLTRWKNRLLAQVSIHWLLGSERVEQVHEFIQHWQVLLTQQGTLSYEMPALETGYAPQEFQGKQIPCSPMPSLSASNPVSIALTARSEKIGPQNALSSMQNWLSQAQKASDPAMRLQYLCEQTKSLPVPVEGEDCWSQVPSIHSTLECSLKLAIALNDAAAEVHGQYSEEMEAQIALRLFQIYAIIDKLARRCPEAQLEGFRVNANALFLWPKSALFFLVDATSREQLHQLQSYFKIDPEAEDLHYDDPENQFRLEHECLFFTRNRRTRKFPETCSGKFFHAQETADTRYFRRLLADPQISAKLDACGRTVKTAEADLFALLYADPPDILQQLDQKYPLPPEGQEKRKALFQGEGNHLRGALLPYPFHVLRMANLLANHFLTSRSKLASFCHITPLVLDKDTTWRARLDLDLLALLPKVGSFFRKQKFSASSLDLKEKRWGHFAEMNSLSTGLENAASERSQFLSHEHFATYHTENWKKRITIWGDSETINNALHLPPRSQPEILNDPPDFATLRTPPPARWSERLWDLTTRAIISPISHILPIRRAIYITPLRVLSPKLKERFEMIWGDTDDQAVRVLSHFMTQKKWDDESLQWLGFFLLQRHGLDRQLRSHPEFSETLGLFFSRELEKLWKQKPCLPALQLIKLGILVKAEVAMLFPDAVSSFPDFRQELLRFSSQHEHVLHSHLILQLLSLSWLFVDPKSASEEMVEKAAYDLLWAKLHAKSLVDYKFINCKFPVKDLLAMSQEAFLKWRETIEVRCKDPQFLNRVLNDIAQKERLLKEPLSWTGTYPQYRSAALSIDFEKGNSIDRSDLHIQETIQKALTLIFPGETLSIGPLKEGAYWISSSPPLQVQIIESQNAPPTLRFTLHLQGKEYLWVSTPAEGEEEETYWMSRDLSQVLTLKKGKFSSLVPVQQSEISADDLWQKPHSLTLLPNARKIRDRLCAPVPLSASHHHLAPLSWFQPFSKVRAFQSIEAPYTIQRIEFPALKLHFNVEPIDGVLQAVGEEEAIAGFFIAKEQKIDSLQHYSHYLLLQNERGQKKVILPPEILGSALFSSIIQQTSGLATSRLFDAQAGSLLQPLLTSFHHRCFIYEVDERNRLSSRDPEALLLLLCYHLAQDRIGDVRHNLLLMENLGKRVPFSPELLTSLRCLELFLLAMQRPESTSIALRLAALQEENQLLQSPSDEQQESFRLLSWIGRQAHLLRHLEKGAHPHFPLDEYQELFVLKSLASQAKQWAKNSNLQAQLGETFPLPSTLLEKMGEFVLFHPTLTERYAFLQQKYGVAQEREIFKFSSLLRALVQEKIGPLRGNLGSTPSTQNSVGPLRGSLGSTPSTQNSSEGEAFSWIQGAIALFSEKSQWNDINHIFFSDTNLDASWETIPLNLLEVTDLNIQQFIHIYYRLSLGEAPPECQQDPIKMVLFEKRSKAWRQSLPLLKAKMVKKHLKQWAKFLLFAAEKKGFPSAEAFDAVAQTWIPLSRRPQKNIGKEIQETQEAKEARKAQEAKEDKEHDEARKLAEKFFSQLRSEAFKASLQSKLTYQNLKKIPLPLGKVALQTIAYYYYPSVVQKLMTASFVWNYGVGTYRRLNHALQGSEKERESMRKEASQSARIDPPLMASWQKALIEEEETTSHFLTSWLEKHFQNGRLKSLEHFYLFNAEGRAMRRELEKILASQKREILSLATAKKHRARSDVEVIQDQVQGSSPSSSPLEEEALFQELLILFGRGEEKALLQKTSLQREEIPSWTLKMYRHLLYATRLHQTTRALKLADQLEGKQGAEVELLSKQLTFELSRSRAYKFDHASSKLIRALLLMEYGTQTMLWESQVEQIKELFQHRNPFPKLVLQLPTGAGKTSVIVPTLSFLTSDRLQAIYNTFPDTLASHCIEQIGDVSRKVFGQTANAMKISRSTPFASENLWALLRVHARAIHQGESLNMRKQDLQALQLRFLESVDAFCQPKPGKNKPDEQALFYAMKLLGLIRTNFRGSHDEFHITNDRTKELNYPLGEKKRVKEDYIAVIEECARLLVVTAEEELRENPDEDLRIRKQIASLVDLKHNRQANLGQNPQLYETQIKPLLAERFLSFFKIPQQDRSVWFEFLCGRSENPPPAHPKRQEISMAAGLLNTILPHTLKEKIFLHYGPSHKSIDPSIKGRRKHALPYSGNQTPIEEARIKNPYAALLKTFLMHLYSRLTEQDAFDLVQKMRELAKKESERLQIPEEDTYAARRFAQWCGGQLSLFQISHPVALTAALNQSDDAILYYVRFCVAEQVEYFPSNLSSNSQNFASMFSSFYAYTATPSDPGTFPQGTQVLRDPKAESQFIELVQRTCSAPGSIVEIENEQPQDALQEILNRFFYPNSPYKAIIDSGSLFNGCSPHYVAQRILEHLEAQSIDLKGVVFFDSEQKLVIWEKGKPAPIPFKQSQIPPSQRITYYDQPHTVGSDIDQSLGAHAILTLSNTLRFDAYAQADGRMRGRRTKNQQVTLAVPRSTKKLISGEEPLTIENILWFTQSNQEATQAESNYLSARSKIGDVLRKTVLDAMIFATTVPEMVTYFQTFRSLFITETQEDPLQLYGLPKTELPAQEALERYKQEQLRPLLQSNLFSEETKQRIVRELEVIGREAHHSYPETVSLSQTSDLDVTQEVVEIQTEQQTVEQKQDQQIEQKQNLEVETQLPTPLKEKLRIRPALWRGDIDYFAHSDWLQCTPPDSKTPHDCALLYSVQALLQQSAGTRALSAAFEGPLFYSNNLLGILEGTPPTLSAPFSKTQLPIFELLVIHSTDPHGQTQISAVAINQKEAHFWREQFQKDKLKEAPSSSHLKIGLFDLGLQAVVATGKNGLKNSDLFSHAPFLKTLVQWKFLAGHTELKAGFHRAQDQALIETATNWVQKHGAEPLKNLFLTIHKQSPASQFPGSDLEFLLNPREI